MNQLISSPSALTNHPKITITPFHQFDIEEQYDHFTGAEMIPSIANMVGDVFKTLPDIGVGSKSRRKEVANAADAQISVLNAQTSQHLAKSEVSIRNNQKMILLGTVGLVLVAAVILVLK